MSDADLASRLRALYEDLRRDTRSRWDRDLPFAELVVDRWERARSLGFGAGTSVYASAYLYGDVRVGRDTWIGPFTLLDGSGGLIIGDWCSISAGVQIYTHDTVRRALTAGRAGPERAPVTIGSRVHIGAQSVVARGVTVEDGSVIGACAFVNRDVAAGTIVAGVPARPIGRVEVVEGDVRLTYGANEAG
jgi:acetyltransferase-like isoleucine patch superfamily enzyme